MNIDAAPQRPRLVVTDLMGTTLRDDGAVLPAYRGPLSEKLTQRMYLLPRGGGLGDKW